MLRCHQIPSVYGHDDCTMYIATETELNGQPCMGTCINLIENMYNNFDLARVLKDTSKLPSGSFKRESDEGM